MTAWATCERAQPRGCAQQSEPLPWDRRQRSQHGRRERRRRRMNLGCRSHPARSVRPGLVAGRTPAPARPAVAGPGGGGRPLEGVGTAPAVADAPSALLANQAAQRAHAHARRWRPSPHAAALPPWLFDGIVACFSLALLIRTYPGHRPAAPPAARRARPPRPVTGLSRARINAARGPSRCAIPLAAGTRPRRARACAAGGGTVRAGRPNGARAPRQEPLLTARVRFRGCVPA